MATKSKRVLKQVWLILFLPVHQIEVKIIAVQQYLSHTCVFIIVTSIVIIIFIILIVFIKYVTVDFVVTLHNRFVLAKVVMSWVCLWNVNIIHLHICLFLFVCLFVFLLFFSPPHHALVESFDETDKGDQASVTTEESVFNYAGSYQAFHPADSRKVQSLLCLILIMNCSGGKDFFIYSESWRRKKNIKATSKL